MKYNRTYHLPWSPGATKDDKRSSTIEKLLSEEIIITEKLDGENCGIERGGVYARSHSAYTVSPWSREVRILHSLIGKDLPENLMIFGENMEGIHSIEYENLDSYFYLFGAREDDSRWLSWDEIEEIAYLLDLKTVPVLFRGKVETEKELKELVDSLLLDSSRLGGEIEGCVIRVVESFSNLEFSEKLLKWVRKDHVTTNEHWTRNWKKAKLNAKI